MFIVRPCIKVRLAVFCFVVYTKLSQQSSFIKYVRERYKTGCQRSVIHFYQTSYPSSNSIKLQEFPSWNIPPSIAMQYACLGMPSYSGVYLLLSWTEISRYPWLPHSIKACFPKSVHSAFRCKWFSDCQKMPLVHCIKWIDSLPAHNLFSPQAVLSDSTSTHSKEAFGGSGQQSRANTCCCADMK